MGRIWIAYNWRYPKVVLGLFGFEFFMTVACLTLFGIADPDTYRTKLWQNGADRHFNSSPSEILYAYANYRPIPVPDVWNSFITQFNIVISVLSMFILLVKSTMWVMHAWIPILSVFVHAALIALYAVSLRYQGAPDLSDPQHPSPGLPWYLSKGCGYATPGNYSFCMQARAAYGVTVVMVVLFSVYFLLSVWNLFITPKERAAREKDRKFDIEMKKYSTYNPDADLSKEEKARQLFMNLPKTPNTPGFALNPMTPRTTAFTQLSGGPPPSASTKATGALPFREHYGDSKGPTARVS